MNRCTSRSGRGSSVARWVIALSLSARALAGQEGRTPPEAVWQFLADSSRAAWVRPLASAVIPGLGQLLAKNDRGAVYLVVETVFLARFIGEYRDGNREGERYRDLAFKIARRGFSPLLRDTAFGYFEEMAKFTESGPFDTDPGPGLAPPWDDRTFNGRIWRLARETFFADPDSVPAPESVEYQRAVEFYRRRAVGPGFLWSWRGAALEHDLFQQSILASDDAFRNATQQLGLLLINHLFSAVDAFVSHRLSLNGRGARLTSDVTQLGRAGELVVRIGLAAHF